MKTLAPFPLRSLAPAALALLAAASLSACGPAAPPPVVRQTQQQQPFPPVAPRTNGQPDSHLFGGNPNNAGISPRQRQADFLNRIREADPQHKTIDRALLNEQNELGLILDRSVNMDSIPALMRTMLTQMAKEFPGQDLSVIAYAPLTPPKKIGTAHFDAQTRDMSYTPATQ